eukprot:TRINITY_DN4095_c0_g1_i7.p1 TRINITY_DN4095_c0_g1~~TRINITY_DN4095_c0_g1_i7.p1  ORF type:complete len:512 (-),score=210.34 TRINITY_DN4095_c0_g1_i7:12-1547(-)
MSFKTLWNYAKRPAAVILALLLFGFGYRYITRLITWYFYPNQRTVPKLDGRRPNEIPSPIERSEPANVISDPIRVFGEESSVLPVQASHPMVEDESLDVSGSASRDDSVAESVIPEIKEDSKISGDEIKNEGKTEISQDKVKAGGIQQEKEEEKSGEDPVGEEDEFKALRLGTRFAKTELFKVDPDDDKRLNQERIEAAKKKREEEDAAKKQNQKKIELEIKEKKDKELEEEARLKSQRKEVRRQDADPAGPNQEGGEEAKGETDEQRGPEFVDLRREVTGPREAWGNFKKELDILEEEDQEEYLVLSEIAKEDAEMVNERLEQEKKKREEEDRVIRELIKKKEEAELQKKKDDEEASKRAEKLGASKTLMKSASVMDSSSLELVTDRRLRTSRRKSTRDETVDPDQRNSDFHSGDGRAKREVVVRSENLSDLTPLQQLMKEDQDRKKTWDQRRMENKSRNSQDLVTRESTSNLIGESLLNQSISSVNSILDNEEKRRVAREQRKKKLGLA